VVGLTALVICAGVTSLASLGQTPGALGTGVGSKARLRQQGHPPTGSPTSHPGDDAGPVPATPVAVVTSFDPVMSCSALLRTMHSVDASSVHATLFVVVQEPHDMDVWLQTHCPDVHTALHTTPPSLQLTKGRHMDAGRHWARAVSALLSGGVSVAGVQFAALVPCGDELDATILEHAVWLMASQPDVGVVSFFVRVMRRPFRYVFHSVRPASLAHHNQVRSPVSLSCFRLLLGSWDGVLCLLWCVVVLCCCVVNELVKCCCLRCVLACFAVGSPPRVLSWWILACCLGSALLRFLQIYSAVVRVDMLKDCGAFPRSMPDGLDAWDFWLQLVQCGVAMHTLPVKGLVAYGEGSPGQPIGIASHALHHVRDRIANASLPFVAPWTPTAFRPSSVAAEPPAAMLQAVRGAPDGDSDSDSAVCSVVLAVRNLGTDFGEAGLSFVHGLLAFPCRVVVVASAVQLPVDVAYSPDSIADRLSAVAKVLVAPACSSENHLFAFYKHVIASRRATHVIVAGSGVALATAVELQHAFPHVAFSLYAPTAVFAPSSPRTSAVTGARSVNLPTTVADVVNAWPAAHRNRVRVLMPCPTLAKQVVLSGVPAAQVVITGRVLVDIPSPLCDCPVLDDTGCTTSGTLEPINVQHTWLGVVTGGSEHVAAGDGAHLLDRIAQSIAVGLRLDGQTAQLSFLTAGTIDTASLCGDGSQRVTATAMQGGGLEQRRWGSGHHPLPLRSDCSLVVSSRLQRLWMKAVVCGRVCPTPPIPPGETSAPMTSHPPPRMHVDTLNIQCFASELPASAPASVQAAHVSDVGGTTSPVWKWRRRQRSEPHGWCWRLVASPVSSSSSRSTNNHRHTNATATRDGGAPAWGWAGAEPGAPKHIPWRWDPKLTPAQEASHRQPAWTGSQVSHAVLTSDGSLLGGVEGPWQVVPEPVENVFLLLSRGTMTGKHRLSASLETACRLHPTATVYVVIPRSASASVAPEFVSAVRQAMLCSFVVLPRFDMRTYLLHSPLREFIATRWREVASSRHAAHVADIFRMVALFKHGGVWMDTDALVTRPVVDVGNTFGLEPEGGTTTFVGTAVLAFRKHHPFWSDCLQRVTPKHYDADKYLCNMESTTQCVIHHPKRFLNCNDHRRCISTAPSEVFYPFWVDEGVRMFGKRDPELHIGLDTSIAMHLWNSQTKRVQHSPSSLVGMIYHRHCITCVAMSGNDQTGDT